jgi:2-polyprenyl-3-methyl-5-hydroxy-6-metoxy-1,4-benzoquinol methylase
VSNLTTDIIQWDIATWSRALLFWEKEIDWSKVTVGLELGARQGGLSLWLASKGIKTICSDRGDVRLTAEALHKKHNVTSLIAYEDIDATSIHYENYFDVIVFKSILGGIGYGDNKAAQQKSIREMYKALKPGGKLLFAENLTASALHKKLRSRCAGWGSAWRYVTKQELEEFLSEFSSKQILSTGFSSVFGRNESQKKFLTAMDRGILNHITPESWKYLGYGYATK